MSTDIGSILRSWLGDSMPQKEGVRALELRVGQIVRGVLLQMLGEGEGIVSVGGVPVRARLEAEIPLGRGVMLQVQPGSNEAAVILKPLTMEAAGAMPGESLKEALRNFGLPDKPWAMELLRNLRRDGFPLDAETARAYAEMAAMKPPRTDARQWMTAADAAFRRGLPDTPLTIASLREALFGASVREQMQTLMNLLDSALKGASQAGSPTWTADAVRLQRLLMEGQELLLAGGRWMAGEAAPGGAGAGSAAGNAAGSPAAAGHATGIGEGGAANVDASAPVPQAQAASEASGTAASAAGGAAAGHAASAAPAAQGSAPPQGMPVGPANAASSEASAAGVRAGQRTDVPPTAGIRQDASEAQADRQAVSASAQAASAQAATASALAGREGADWLARLLQWLGFGHERSLASGDVLTAQYQAARAGSAGAETPPDVLPGGSSNPWMMNEARGETLKSALLALASREDAPPALREAAQTLAQHITGQQLLLAGDRGTLSPYHYVTLFIPIADRHGDATAAVHVQTRKKRRGEWDADNVRLLFDLNMKHLGHTVVDVQVVDRIVSMKVYSDDPWFRDLAESSRDTLAAAFQDAGYQLSAMRAVPFPDREEDEGAGNRQGAAADFPLIRLVNGDPASGGILPSRPYKGVDLRI